MPIKVKHKGDFKNTERFMKRAKERRYLPILETYGRIGVQALSAATPKDTGKTASSWDYGISEENGKITLYWTNSSENKGVSIVLLLLYGHATPGGAYIEGMDFVSPAIRPVFERIANQSWKEVTR